MSLVHQMGELLCLPTQEEERYFDIIQTKELQEGGCCCRMGTVIVREMERVVVAPPVHGGDQGPKRWCPNAHVPVRPSVHRGVMIWPRKATTTIYGT